MNMLFSEGEKVKRRKEWEVKGRNRGSPFLYFPVCPGLFSNLTPIERRAVNRPLAFLPITYGYWQCKYSLTELLNSFVCTPRQLQSDVNTSPLILKQTSQLTWPFTQLPASSSATSFFTQRQARNAREWWRSRRDHGKEKNNRRSAVSPVLSFPPSFARKFASRKGRLGTRQLNSNTQQIFLKK